MFCYFYWVLYTKRVTRDGNTKVPLPVCQSVRLLLGYIAESVLARLIHRSHILDFSFIYFSKQKGKRKNFGYVYAPKRDVTQVCI